jgi:glycosyltransferase involved in cell wall biosynthesis
MGELKPLVSVFIPTYDGARFIGETLQSVLGQTYENLELIVVDDRSQDDTADVVAGYAASDARVRLLRKDVREGPCRARNDALSRTRGSLLCWLDQDDLWMPTKVQEQVRLMSERPDVGLVYTYFDAFDSQSRELIDWPDGRRDIEGDVLAPLFIIGCFIGSITTMFRRQAVSGPKVRVRERDFSFGDDFYLWLTIALNWQVACIPRPLAAYRRHATNESARLTAESNVALRLARLLQEFVEEYPQAADRLGRSERMGLARHTLLAARFESTQGHRRRAAQLILRALAWDPAVLPRATFGTLAHSLRKPLPARGTGRPVPSMDSLAPAGGHILSAEEDARATNEQEGAPTVGTTATDEQDRAPTVGSTI